MIGIKWQLRASKLRVSGRVFKGWGGVGEGGKGKIPAFKNFKNVRRRTHHSSVVLAIKCYLKSAVRVLSTCVTCSKRWYEVDHASLVSNFGGKKVAYCSCER